MVMRSIEYIELQELLSNLCDDHLDRSRTTRLGELLENDPDARSFCIDYLHIEASLHWDCVDVEAALTAGLGDRGYLTDSNNSNAVNLEDRETCPNNTGRSPLVSLLGEGIEHTGSFLNRPMPFWMLISAIVLIPLATLFTVVIVNSTMSDRMIATQNDSLQKEIESTQSNRGNSSKSDQIDIQPKAEAIAYMERQSEDARWASSQNSATMGIGLLPGRELQLTAGLAEIAFESGAKVILQAPVTLVLDERNACWLESGKLSAYVPPNAKGFCVRSEDVTVVDLGTEFGMHVSSASDTEVHVFTGVVEAMLNTQDNDALHPATESKPLRLERNVALHIDPLTVTVMNKPINPKQFVRKMPRSGVTDRPLIRNASFEFPTIDSSKEARDYFKPEFGNTWNMSIVGWEQMVVDGANLQPSGYQLSPYKSPRDAIYNTGPGATDGRQVIILTLREKGSEHETVLENWIFQSLGEVMAGDVGKTLELKADVTAREAQPETRVNGAKATVCFASDVTTHVPGTVVGEAGVVEKVIWPDGMQTLTARLTVNHQLVGKKLFIRLSVANDNPKTLSEQYHFDNVRCRVLE